jgi:hypothetical protein
VEKREERTKQIAVRNEELNYTNAGFKVACKYIDILLAVSHDYASTART